MSVLVEALTVIIRRERLTAIHPHAVDHFFTNAPNATARGDSYLVAVGFMNPDDARIYVRTLEQEAGFRHLENGECVDIAVVCQIRGPTAPCIWLDVATDARGVVHAWLKGTDPGPIAAFEGWTFEGSMSERPIYLEGVREVPPTIDGQNVYHQRTYGQPAAALIEGRDRNRRAAIDAAFNALRARQWESCAVLWAPNSSHQLVFRLKNQLALVYVESDDESKFDEHRASTLFARAIQLRAMPLLAKCKIFSPVHIKTDPNYPIESAPRAPSRGVFGRLVDRVFRQETAPQGDRPGLRVAATEIRFDDPTVESIEFIDLQRRAALREELLDFTTPVAISDWEELDFSIQIVRDTIEKDGFDIKAWSSEPGERPHILAQKGGKEHYIVVGPARYPIATPVFDNNRLQACAERAATTGAVLAKAAVSLANSEDKFIGDFPLPLWRGEAALARFTGLEIVDPNTVSADRAVRIFVSSTFSDFREERRAIVQSVIPELGRRGLERDVAVTAVDLQWGVTSEEARQNLQLSACIREVDRCAPFFLALLGERYGWVPPSSAFAGLGSLERSQGLSITELEVRHAVLPGSTRNPSALAYARGLYSETINRQKKLYDSISKCPTRDEQIGTLEASGSRPTPRGARAPFDNLVVDLINRGHDVRLLQADYVQDITAQLWSLIETHFPPLDEFDARRRQDRRHRHYGFAQSQLLDVRWPTSAHIAHELQRGAADTIVCQNSWETAAVAAMVRQGATRNPGRQVFEHYCGLDGEPGRTAELCGRLIEFFSRVSGRPTTIPTGAEPRARRLTEQLQRMSGKGSAPITVVIAEGDLLDADGLAVVAALGRVPAMQVLLTMTQTSDSEPAIHWSQEEIASFATQQLKRSGRSLDANLLDAILSHSLSTNLYFIRFVCAFLDRWAVHETLERELERALSVHDWPDILEVVASRAEEAGSATRNEIGRVLHHLKLSESGVELQKLVDIPDIGGRIAFEVRSCFPFLIDEWGARWRLSRGPAARLTLSGI
jgi:hypothetical protein